MGFEIEEKDKYTNLLFTDRTTSATFNFTPRFSYLDGFSPNLNKELHVGHFMNLVYAKAFSSMNVAEHTVAIYNDTFPDTNYEHENYKSFGYKPNLVFYASKIRLPEEWNWIMVDGKGDYAGTKCFVYDDNYQVGIRSNGETTYVYQDVALSYILGKRTLYLTGAEQKEHFEFLDKVADRSDYGMSKIHHLPLGLITLNGKKMSSRLGNTVMMKDLIASLHENIKVSNADLTNDELDKIAYNAFAGSILKSNPKSSKNVNEDILCDLKQSQGLYMSYCLVRLNSMMKTVGECKEDVMLAFHYHKSVLLQNPSILFNELYEYCKAFSKDYETKSYINNKSLYSSYHYNISKYMKLLGLYTDIKRM
jgi:arginyl-tRNA synthetase